jgi:hypothetical protein
MLNKLNSVLLDISKSQTKKFSIQHPAKIEKNEMQTHFLADPDFFLKKSCLLQIKVVCYI